MVIELIQGDCIEVMAGMDANSIDTCITDPPYGLSDSSSTQGISQRVYNALVKIGFPDLYERYAEIMQRKSLFGVAGDSSLLGIKDGSIGIESGVGMPICPVDLQGDAVVNQEIDNGNVTPCLGVADGPLPRELDTQGQQFLGDFILKLGDVTPFGIAGDVPDSCLAEAFFSGFAVPIFAQPAPSLPGLETSSSMVILADDDIGPGYDALCKTKRTPCIVALPRAVNTLMLRFDLRGVPVELLPTYRASHLATIGQLGGPKLIRAFPAAGGLAPMFQPHRVRFVVPVADGAYTIYWLHLWAPISDEIKGIIPRGGFMGKAWDATLPDPQAWREAFRVLKPGAMLLAFGGTRTFHRLTCAIEDAGFEIRDCIMFVYGSGFPKSHDISKAIDKAAGAEREVGGIKTRPDGTKRPNKANWTTGGTNTYAQDEWTTTQMAKGGNNITAPATDAARLFDGWGTALKPSWEPIIVAMKPREGTYAENALKWGVAGLNVDGGRVGTEDMSHQWDRAWNENSGGLGKRYPQSGRERGKDVAPGRWPANLLTDGSEEVVALFPQSKSGGDGVGKAETVGYEGGWADRPMVAYTDSGSASRFFQVCPPDEPSRLVYASKPSRAERNAGCEGLGATATHSAYGDFAGTPEHATNIGEPRANHHPTVKSLALMRYLCRLTATPTAGVVLDPFMGSGSTGCGAVLEGRDFIGIELDADYVEIARRRIEHWRAVWQAEQDAPKQMQLLDMPRDPQPTQPAPTQAAMDLEDNA